MRVLAESALQVRPELFQNVADCIHADLHDQFRYGAAGGPVIRIIGIRYGYGCRVPKPFGVVELSPTGVALGPKDPRNGVGEPGPATSGAAPEVARILVEDGWIHRL